MPELVPFRGIRYRAAGASADQSAPTECSALTAPPYDVIDDDARTVLAARDEHNAVHLILPVDDATTDRYEVAAKLFRAWREQGVLVTDPSPRLYGYRMRFTDDGRERATLGVIGALGLEKPGPGILPHERTLARAKSDRLALLRATRANLDPIWGLSLTKGLSALLEPAQSPVAVCTDDDGVVHELFAIDDPARAAEVRAAVAATPLVLADGHHRFETACNYRDELTARGSEVGGAASIMALVVELADDQLSVRAIHRLLDGIPDRFDLRNALGAAFEIQDRGPITAAGIDELQARMQARGGLGLVDDAGLALLLPRPEALASRLADEPELLRDLPATVFEAGVLPALPGVEITYRDDASSVASLVEKGTARAAVLLAPVTIDTIRAAALARVRMPQKTTYFQPKLRTGLVFRSLDG